MFRVKEGDLDKLGLLFERYKKMLFAFFFRMSFDENLSEDLVQNVFIRIMKYRHTFKGHGEFKMWMFHIARNVHNEHFRYAGKLGKQVELHPGHEQYSEHGTDPSRVTVENDLELLTIAMSRLDPEKKEILTLSKIEGIKYKEIAVMLNISESSVKIKVFRALKELRTIFRKIKMNYE